MSNKPSKLAFFMLLIVWITTSAMILGQTRQSLSEGQRVTKQELDTRFALARSLAQEEKFEQALNEYLFVFDNSRGMSGYAGVRLSFIPSEIAAIGRVYRPALVALHTRRDEREKLVVTGAADFDVTHELTSLNKYLDEPERNVDLYDKLKAMGPAYSSLSEDMVTLIWEQLVDAKRFADLKDRIDQLARRVANQIAESVINRDFADGTVLSSPQYQDYLRQSIIEDGGRVYETLLALGKREKAENLAKWMLTFSSDGEMYARLINSAINVNRPVVASDLIDRATKGLKRGEDLRLVREAAKRLAKAN